MIPTDSRWQRLADRAVSKGPVVETRTVATITGRNRSVQGVGHCATRRSIGPVSLFLVGAMAGLCSPVWAGQADVVDIAIQAVGINSFRIDATVAHSDEGWDHYANQWQVFTLDGQLLGTRELLHPHVDEPPFTRSLTLNIPSDVDRVQVVAGDSVHGIGAGESMEIDVPHGG